MGLEERSKQLRLVAFGGVVLSTVAVAACLVTFPMIFHYVQTLQVEIDSEVTLCMTRSRELYSEVINHQAAVEEPDMDLMAEMISYGQTHFDIPSPHYVLKRQTYQECCTCHRGAPGGPGGSGTNGRDGVPGAMGRPGNNGQPAPVVLPTTLYPPQCPCEAGTGTVGAPGNKGPPGPPGNSGGGGQPGQAGAPGGQGGKGARGQPGRDGGKGAPGDRGVETVNPGPPGGPGAQGAPGGVGLSGAPGRPGESGRPGAQGPPGDSPFGAGRPGQNGFPGERGNPGFPGPNGPCDHCPAARLAPGY